jgi:anti-sigma B factor antagonist
MSTMATEARVVAPVGELDLRSHAAFREALLNACAADRAVIVDMARVTFMDSSAVGLVVATAKRCRRQGIELRVVNAGGQPLRVMRLTGADLVVPIEPA